MRDFLRQKLPLNPLQVSQLTYSSIGWKVLNYVGDLMQTSIGTNGAQAIRASLIVSAINPEGLSLLNFLRNYPSQVIRIDASKVMHVVSNISRLTKATESTIAAIQTISETEAKTQTITPEGVATLKSLGALGSIPVKKQTLTFNDEARKRQIVTDIYLPTGLNGKVPLALLSHGLGSDRTEFGRFGEQLASYGVVVVNLEHPGSNGGFMKRFFRGYEKEFFDANEFIDRPRDVSFVLDEVERLFPGRVDTQNVAMLGHSFGGYTAMALGGATVDFNYLAKECDRLLNATNISLLLQCEALKLPQSSRGKMQLRDPRIKFVLVANPVTRSIFGPLGMQTLTTPTFIISGTEDLVTPLVLEQVEPFTWMKIDERYLLVAKGHRHVTDVQSFTRTFVPNFSSIVTSIDPKYEVMRSNSRAISTAAVLYHLTGKEQYKTFLTAAYASAVNETPYMFFLLKNFSREQFEQLAANIY